MRCNTAEKRPIPVLLPRIEREEWRLLPVEGAGNFRDLGGYETRNGETVRWGKVYRSGHLHDLTGVDVEYLNRLGIGEIVDFRGPSEVLSEPDCEIPGVKTLFLPVNIAGTDLRERIVSVIRGESTMDMASYMKDVNRQLVRDYSDIFGRWLRKLAGDSDPVPQIFHCTAGKDRTGFAAAILLRAVGVSEETVMADYLKTNQFTAAQIEKTIRKVTMRSLHRYDGELLRPLLGVDNTYLQTAFDVIEADWGDFDTYVRRALDLTESDIGCLKKRFLEG